MSDVRIVELTVPGRIQFRDLAVRVIMESCALVTKDTAAADKASASDAQELPGDAYEFANQFTIELTSAFSEVYNNITLHGYTAETNGAICIRIRIGQDHLIVEIADTGKSFDIASVPLPEVLPTGGMGIHIARKMLDDLKYESGSPNRWRLVKYMKTAGRGPRL
jgi:anti-sigma regulatory factor (Ser/Thr protein kinase)